MQAELHEDIESLAPDTLISPQESPTGPATLAPAAKAVGSTLAPNITSLVSGEPAPGIADLPAYGKVPSSQDPRINQAIGEFGELGASILPLITTGNPITLGHKIIDVAARPMAIAAGATGLTAASVGPADAAKLTRTQKQELEVKRQQLQMEGQEASRRSSEMALQELELRRQGLQFEAEAKQKEAEGLSQIALNKQREEQNLNRAEEARKANAPFRERFPNLSNAMSNTGLALAALVPFGTRTYQASKGLTNTFVKTWEDVAKGAETALKNKEMDHARILVDQLVSFKKEAVALEQKANSKSNVVVNAMSAGFPIETQVLPELMDLTSRSQETRDRAKDILTDPMRVASGVGQGLIGLGIGTKTPVPGVGNPSIAKATSEGLIKSMKDAKAAATRARSKTVAAERTGDDVLQGPLIEGAGVRITNKANPRASSDNMTRESVINDILKYKETPANPYQDAVFKQKLENMIRNMDKDFRASKPKTKPNLKLIDD